MNQKQYNRIMGLTSVHISPKQRKINYLSAKYGWPQRDLKKLKSKQLGAIQIKTVDNPV